MCTICRLASRVRSQNQPPTYGLDTSQFALSLTSQQLSKTVTESSSNTRKKFIRKDE